MNEVFTLWCYWGSWRARSNYTSFEAAHWNAEVITAVPCRITLKGQTVWNNRMKVEEYNV